MEVCGTHTMTLHRSGLKPRLRQVGIDMISGPGCPVCITPDYFHEAIIDLLVARDDILVCTFGDMTRVPTRKRLSADSRSGAWVAAENSLLQRKQ